jgi:hypothetical protein
MRATALFLVLIACGAKDASPQTHVDAAADSSEACRKTDDCKDLNTSFFQYPACCSPHVTCGYQITYDDAFFEVYPQARDVLFNLASDDPEGKCVPESYVFPTRPGTYDHRVELEDGPEEEDVLVAAQCESRGFWVFTLPGCCMRDNRCGISTDEVAGTFEVLLDGAMAPFSKPECVTADELNMQLKASPLDAFARIPATSGDACDYAALAEAQPRFRHTAKK